MSAPTPEPNASGIADFIAAHPEWSDTTKTCYREWLEELQDFLTPLHWLQAQRADLMRFEQHLNWRRCRRGGLLSPNTVYQAMRCVRAFYRWAVLCRKVSRDPMREWMLPRPPCLPERTLSRPEVLQLFNAADLSQATGQRDLVLVSLLYHAEMSVAKCRLFTCEDFDLARGKMDGHLVAAVERYRQDGRRELEREPLDVLLLTVNGVPFGTTEGLNQRVKWLGNRAGFTDLSARTLIRSHQDHQDELYQRRLPF